MRPLMALGCTEVLLKSRTEIVSLEMLNRSHTDDRENLSVYHVVPEQARSNMPRKGQPV